MEFHVGDKVEKEHYQEELAKIDSILDKYRQVHSDVRYDVFISVKQQIF